MLVFSINFVKGSPYYFGNINFIFLFLYVLCRRVKLYNSVCVSMPQHASGGIIESTLLDDCVSVPVMGREDLDFGGVSAKVLKNK